VRTRAVGLATELAGGHLAGCRLAVLGAAFTAGSDNIRNFAAVAMAQTAVRAGAVVTVHDPAAMDRLRAQYPQVACAPSAEAAARDAELVLALTDWPEFGEADPEVLGKSVAHRRVVGGRIHRERQVAGRNQRRDPRPRSVSIPTTTSASAASPAGTGRSAHAARHPGHALGAPPAAHGRDDVWPSQSAWCARGRAGWRP